MKYSIVYNSPTGNTEMLANTIAKTLSQGQCMYFGGTEERTEERIEDSDILFVGFWTDKGTCDIKTAEFLKSLKNWKIFLFGTAGYGGDEAYFKQILESVKKNIDISNHIIGTYMCQGKMPLSVRHRYEKMIVDSTDSAKIQGMIDNFDRALSHPDIDDCNRLKEQVEQVNF